MGFLDRAKVAAQRARSGARVAREQGQHRINELQARRQAEVLLREVGLASYEENQGIGGREAVVRAVAKLDEHVRAYNIDLSTSGLRGYLRTATGSGSDDVRGSRPQETPTADESAGEKPAEDDVPPATDEQSPADDKTATADKSENDTPTSGGDDSGTSAAAAKDTGSATKKGGTAEKGSTKKSTTAKKTTTAKKSTSTPAAKSTTTPAAESTTETSAAKKSTSAAKKTTTKKTTKKTDSTNGAGTAKAPKPENGQ